MVRMPGPVMIVALVAGLATRVDADPFTIEKSRMIVSAGVLAGPESPVPVSLLADFGVGIRRCASLTWNLHVARSLFAAHLSELTSKHDYTFAEVRAGPTWWSCGSRACIGLSVELGVHYIRTHETGSEVNPIDTTRRDYMIVGDARYRAWFPSGPGIGFELSAGVRLKGDFYASGEASGSERVGGGLLLGVAIVGAI